MARAHAWYSYFLSETIKYAYLAIDEDPWLADKFVFNTEGHPWPVFEWREWEKLRYGIK
jgi:mannosyl-oligosaccharide alpha-1,2-mannosidase